jgi:hypothetical protein
MAVPSYLSGHWVTKNSCARKPHKRGEAAVLMSQLRRCGLEHRGYLLLHSGKLQLLCGCHGCCHAFISQTQP